MTGKQKCAILKEIRRDIAKKNDISIRIDECTHKGKCRGTCPRCEAEVRILERELEAKKKRGLQTAIAGVSAGILAASLASCVPVAGEDPNPNDTTAGMPVIETETEEAAAIAGEIAPPDEQTDGDDDEYMLEGDVLAPDYTDDVLLEGEPPVDDYE